MSHQADLGRRAYLDCVFSYDGLLSEDHLDELEELLDRIPDDQVPIRLMRLSLKWRVLGRRTSS